MVIQRKVSDTSVDAATYRWVWSSLSEVVLSMTVIFLKGGYWMFQVDKISSTLRSAPSVTHRGKTVSVGWKPMLNSSGITFPNLKSELVRLPTASVSNERFHEVTALELIQVWVETAYANA